MNGDTMANNSQIRPQLLVSVRNATELEAALAGGANWIDFKEPRAGALGGVQVEVARECTEIIAERSPVSAALGEICDWPNAIATGLMNVEGVGVVKLGLAGCAGMPTWRQTWFDVEKQALACQKQLVAVIYADWKQAEAPSPEEILDLALASSCEYLLIDTFEKRGVSSLGYLPKGELRRICHAARKGSLKTVLAGSLSIAMLADLPLELIDVVAVRGAVCNGDRTGEVQRELVKEFRKALDALAEVSIY